MLASRSTSSLLLFACILALGACNCSTGRGGGGGVEDADLDAMEMDSAVDVAVDVTEDVAPDATEDTQADVSQPDPTLGPENCLAGDVFSVGVPSLRGLFFETKWDGEALWVTWTQESEADREDVWAARYACNGVVLVEPFEITEIAGRNSRSHLAVTGDRVVFVWWNETTGRTPLQSTHYRIMERSGNPVTRTMDVITTADGGPNIDTHWQCRVAGHEQGFIISGMRGMAYTTPDGDADVRRAAYAMKYDRDGVATDPIIRGALVPINQIEPDVAARSASEFSFAWTHGDDTNTTEVFLKKGDGNASALWPQEGRQMAVALAYGDGGSIWAAMGLQLIGTPGFTVLAGDISGTPYRFEGNAVTPRIATGVDSAALTYHQISSGQRSNVFIARLSDAGGAEEPRQLNTEASRSVSTVGVTHVRDDIYFVTWTEGDRTDELKGRAQVVDLAR